MGRLTADPELRQTQTGIPTVRFSMAVNRRFAKEGQQNTDFINCIAWRNTAEFISKYFGKGNMIAIVGSIQTGSYEKDGRKIYTTDILVDEAYFTGAKNADAQSTQQQQQQSNNTFNGFTALNDSPSDELPFG